MKKIISLLAIVLSSTGIFAHDFAVDGIYYNLLGGDSVAVTYEGNSNVSSEYSGSVTIPETVDYNSTTYRVTSIGDWAFNDCSSLTEVTIGNSVTSISNWAFNNCSSLTEVTWNAKNYADFEKYSVTPFSDIASQITSFTFGNEVKHIPARLCYGISKLTEIIIPNSVTTIGEYAFSDCSSLTEVTIGNSVTTIGDMTFYSCSSLTQTNYTGDLASWCKIQFAAWSANPISYSHNLYINGQSITNLVIPEGVTSISDDAFWGLTPLTTVSFPSTLTSIGSHTFEKCSGLTSITIPNSVTEIGSSAFYGCSGLTSITIPNSVKTIGNWAFEYCTNLTDVTIGTGLDTLGIGAFAGCKSLKTFICQSTQAIEYYEFEDYEEGEYYQEYAEEGAFLLCNKQLDSIIAPAQFFDLKELAWSSLAKSIHYIQVNSGELTPDAFGVINRSYKVLETLDMAAATNTDIADEALKGCYNLETLLLPSQLERIGYMAVADCKSLKAIDVPATVTDIDDSAFENCRSIETLTFGGQQPASAPAFEETHHRRVSTASTSALQRIGNWAFYNCHELQHLEIPEGVTEIGAAAFYGCTYLEDLTLPASVQSIGDNCFALCSKLNKITCLATVPPTIEAKTFYDVNRAIPLYVPEASINDYANDTYWGEFINTQAAESTTGVERPFMRVSGDVRKVLENGQVILIRDGVRYNVLGVRL